MSNVLRPSRRTLHKRQCRQSRQRFVSSQLCTSECPFSIFLCLDVMNSITYSHYAGGVVGSDGENIMKAFSIHPTMLGRGHVILESSGPIWVGSLIT